jgi:hypothetical protein
VKRPFFIDQPGQYRRYHLQSGLIGYSFTVNEAGGRTLFRKPFGNNFAAAVNNNHRNAFFLQFHQIAQRGIMLPQGRTAYFDNQ